MDVWTDLDLGPLFQGLPLVFITTIVLVLLILRGRSRLEWGLPLVLTVLALAWLAQLGVSELEGRGPETISSAVLEGGQRLAKAITRQVTTTELEFGWLETAVVILLFSYLFRAWLTTLRVCEPGPVEVGEVKNATGSPQLQGESYASLMRTRLADIGLLPPPAVPSGTLQQDVVGLVESSPLATAGWLGKAVTLLLNWAIPRTGHQVTTTLRSGTYGEFTSGATVTLLDLRSERVETVRTFWKRSFEEAVSDATDYVYKTILDHEASRCIPSWRRWTVEDGSSIGHYLWAGEAERHADALELSALLGAPERKPELVDEARRARQVALGRYRGAAELEPGNVVVRLRIANLYEMHHEFVKALEIYLEATELWPGIVEARYRLASAYGFIATGVDQWKALGQDSHRQKYLKQLIASRHLKLAGDLSKRRVSPEETFRKLAMEEWSKLKHLLAWHRVAWARLTAGPGHVHQWASGSVIAPWSTRRRRLRNAVSMAQLVAEVGDLVHQTWATEIRVLNLDRRVKRRLKGWRSSGWEVRYNAACFYSVALGMEQLSSSHRRQFATQAIDLLTAVTRDPASSLRVQWLEQDPDMSNLRKDPLFVDWRNRFELPPLM